MSAAKTGIHQPWPSDLPTVVAVGGVTLPTTAKGASTAWYDAGSGRETDPQTAQVRAEVLGRVTRPRLIHDRQASSAHARAEPDPDLGLLAAAGAAVPGRLAALQ